MSNITQELSGTIERFLFQNNENGYAVFVLNLAAKQQVIAKGHIPQIHAGQQVELTGIWVSHPKFGKQFEVQQCVAQVPTSLAGLQKYLGSGLIKGIGPIYAKKLVEVFGSNVLEIIDKEPERLARVDGIGPKRLSQIVQGFKEQKEVSHIMVFLQDKGVSPTYAAKIYKTYKHESIALVQENPYRLAQDIWGMGFKTADQIAQQLGIAKDSLKRVKAGIIHIIGTELSNGHLYSQIPTLKEKVIALLEVENSISLEPILKQALHHLYDEDAIKLISYNDEHYITLTQYYLSEKGVATKIKKLIESPSTVTVDANKLYQQLRTPASTNAIMLNEEQQKGVLATLLNKITIITGGPGTGKTTLIKTLLGLLDEHQLSYKLAAPTGRAAKRITEGTGRIALTLHRLLEFDMAHHGFSRNEKNALVLDFLIIDEASMIDIFLGHAILKAMPYNAHLVFIGDVDQLPSVGAGNFLNDIIASQIVTTIRLKQIFRQAQDSLIIVNAHRINQGEFPLSTLPDAKKDFVFMRLDEPTMVHEQLITLFTQKLKRYGISSANTMVLVPMNRGSVGTHQLNHTLQNIINPVSTTNQIMHGMYTYKMGDRVMQIRNNYDKAVFNGDMGFICEINTTDRILSINYDDKIVAYESHELDELVLAYAISIHKSQGSEYDAIIIPLFMQHFMLLQRNLVYTAITRAKKLCIFMGQPRALAMAIKNNKGLERTTFLRQYLTTDLQCR